MSEQREVEATERRVKSILSLESVLVHLFLMFQCCPARHNLDLGQYLDICKSLQSVRIQ